MRHFKFYVMNIYIKKHFKLLSPPLLVTRRFLLMGFLVMPKEIRVEKRFTVEWAHQPHSKVHFPHMAQMATCEVDVPSLQPSTQH